MPDEAAVAEGSRDERCQKKKKISLKTDDIHNLHFKDLRNYIVGIH